MKLGSLLSATSLVSILTFSAIPAFAQEATTTTEDTTTTTQDVEEAEASPITVTGSRIRRDEFSTAEPITVITAQEITQGGFNSASDALQSTAVTGGTSQINNYYGGYVTDGGTGANTLGLRGLGPARTLILLNGRRLAPAGTRGSVGSTDLNVLPTAMIDRIEILKAGASSVYGSDAIAGVVNILTKRDLEGFYLDGQHNVLEVGAGGSRRYSASLGFNSDRFSVSGSLEYYKRDALKLNDLDFLNCPIEGYTDGAGGGLGSDDFIDPATGQPKCFTINNGGVTINTLGVPTRQAIGRTSGVLGNFNRLRPNSAITAGTAGFEGVGTYDRDSFDPRSQEEEAITGAETWTGFAQASYKSSVLGDAEFYVESLVNRRKSSNTLYRQLSLDYEQGSLLLPIEFRNGALLNPTETSNGNLIAARAFIGYGNTSAKQQVDFVKVGGGVRGDFTPISNWRYDIYASKSWSDGRYEAESFLTDRLALSSDAVSNGAGGFTCRSSAPGCVPFPVLSAAVIGGDLSPQFRDWIVDNTTGTTKFRETVVSAAIDGPIFRMPGGDVQVALGAEYRSSSINDQPDANSVRGNLFGLTSASPTVGTDKVWEVFGEVNVPILSDVTAFYRLNVSGSFRYTDYQSYGGDHTYKVAGEWEPIRGVAFRGSYGTSYRAPALFEQYLGATSGFQASSVDPCNDFGQDPNATVRANCASEGLAPDFQQTNGVTVYNVGGAASGLKAETSTNWSVGGVLRPRFGEGFGDLSFAVDYYDIRVDNGVSRVGYSAILSRCYEDPQFRTGGGFCRLVVRDGNNALSINDSYVNIATDVVRGIDYNLRYARNFGTARVILNGQVTQYLEQSNKLFPEDPFDDFNGIITSPEFTGTFDASLQLKNVTARYGLEWTDGDNTKTYNYYGVTPAGGYLLEVDDFFLHTASVQVRTDDERFAFTVGVRNFTNAKLPLVTSAISTVGNVPLYSGYDYRGRQFFANVAAKF